ncbi:MAG: class I SAM-dependent RNA methyltransferase [Bacteroidetes bacterium]|nr:MAG: class I SAM-dependent RNA methyltransferase [Bacteroidota bacterium]TNF00121.1 MAG: class I SAM-dependent RNA methyltransferase [Bacteroidota bacterium]
MAALKLTIKTFFGLEGVLKQELEELGYTGIEVLNRAVQVQGTWDDVYKLNVHLRCAISVLVELKSFRIKKEKDLYDVAYKYDWTSLFDVKKTFAVKGAIHSEVFRHSQYPYLLVKDAIVDCFRDKTGDRPDVNVKTPQVMIDIYVNNDQVTLSLNSSGAPLFQRGYRDSKGEAPLNEVVAAGLIKLSGWDKKMDLIDPFCGSGTIAIEAALMAADIPATIERRHYAFKNLKNFNEDTFEAIFEKINKRVTSLPCNIYASDISAEMVTKTRRNLRALPVGRFVKTEVCSFNEVKNKGEKGMIITNPPYGERMGENVEELYQEIGTWLKHEMTGYTCWLISSNNEALKQIGLKPDNKIRLFNGKLECSFRSFSVFEGKRSEMIQKKADH